MGNVGGGRQQHASGIWSGSSAARTTGNTSSTLVAILLPETAAPYPTCIGGARRTPPEDVGGTHGYEEYLAALADPEHEEHENMLQWRGPFDPETFSPVQVNPGLQKKFRSRKLAKAAKPT